MKRKLLLICVLSTYLFSLQAQSNLTIDQSYTVEEMVMDFFNHPDITISNVNYEGSPAAYGFFDSGDPDSTALEVGAGIFICSGEATIAIGPNESASESGNNGSPGDGDLELLSGGFGPTQDAAIITFDLTASTESFLDFNYVFGSEEYCEFSNSQFNDVFGFFVSGPGMTGSFSNNAVNIATLPGTSDYVGINTINELVNPDLFIPNSGSCNSIAMDPVNMEYDGFTNALNASFQAVAGETYQIKLAISDVSDAAYDSGVFISFNSLSMDSVLIPPAEFAVGSITSGATVNFENNSSYATSYFWDFGNGITSTEKNPGPINFVNAGTYQVSLTTQNYCCTDVYTQMVTVGQSILEVIGSTNPVLCYESETGSIDFEVSGGAPPYDIVWNPAISSFDNLAAGLYQYTVTDAANEIISGELTITSPEDMLGNVIATADDIDQQSTGACNVNVTGGVEPYTYLWSNGLTDSEIINLSAGIYNVTVTDANGCTAVWGGSVDASFSAITITTTTINNPLNCFGDSNGGIEIDISGGVGPYNIVWSPMTTDLMNLSAGDYSFTITDAVGTETNMLVEIEEPEELVWNLDNIIVNPATAGQADGTAFVEANGGTLPYTYEWSTGETTNLATDLTTGIYFVTVQDANGCENSLAVEVSETVSLKNNNDFAFQLFPNPATDYLRVKWSEAAEVVSVRVFDVLGNIIVVNTDLLEDNLDVNFSSKPASGIYYLELKLEDGRTGVERFMVK